MKRTDSARDLYRYLRDFTGFVYQNSTCPDKVELQKSMSKYVSKIRADIRKLSGEDPIEFPLTSNFRKHWDVDDDPSYTEYGILADMGDDEDVEQYIRDVVYIPEWSSPYDCTGRPFTMWCHWKRTPAGIAVVHRVCYDI